MCKSKMCLAVTVRLSRLCISNHLLFKYRRGCNKMLSRAITLINLQAN